MNLNDFSKWLQYNKVKNLRGSEYFPYPLYILYIQYIYIYIYSIYFLMFTQITKFLNKVHSLFLQYSSVHVPE